MTNNEIEIWNEIHVSERAGIILPFNLLLVKNGADRRIVPSVKLNDDRIFMIGYLLNRNYSYLIICFIQQEIYD